MATIPEDGTTYAPSDVGKVTFWRDQGGWVFEGLRWYEPDQPFISNKVNFLPAYNQALELLDKGQVYKV